MLLEMLLESLILFGLDCDLFLNKVQVWAALINLLLINLLFQVIYTCTQRLEDEMFIFPSRNYNLSSHPRQFLLVFWILNSLGIFFVFV